MESWFSRMNDSRMIAFFSQTIVDALCSAVTRPKMDTGNVSGKSSVRHTEGHNGTPRAYTTKRGMGIVPVTGARLVRVALDIGLRCEGIALEEVVVHNFVHNYSMTSLNSMATCNGAALSTEAEIGSRRGVSEPKNNASDNAFDGTALSEEAVIVTRGCDSEPENIVSYTAK